jgi:predicted metal-dependent peptidase
MKDKEELLKELKRRIVFKYFNPFVAVFSHLIFKADIDFVDMTSEELEAYAFTDGEKIFIPKDVREWDTEKIAVVVLHEILHLCRDDFERSQHVESPELWNQLSDAYINKWILKGGFEKDDLPEYCITESMFSDVLGENWTENYTTEQAYTLLIRKGGKPYSFPKHRVSIKESKRQPKKINEWRGTFESIFGMYGLDTAEFQKIKNEIIGAPPLDLPAVLNKIFRSVVPEDYSHIEYDKVLWANEGLYLPDVIGFQKANILFCIDVSGSITVEMAKKFVNIAYSTMKKYHLKEADFLYFDSKIKNIERRKRDFTEFSYSGGGTSYVDVFKFLETNFYDLVVILTDGYGEYPDEKLDVTIVWAIPRGGYTREAREYGDVIELPRVW